MSLKAVAFDWGHTIMDECRDRDVPLDRRPIHLMPAVADALPRIQLPLAIWANTRVATESDLREWLERAGMSRMFQWVITSVDAGARKPSPEFFEYALRRCGLTRQDVLFVGNQLNTDILGAEASGIASVWLAGHEYRSTDDQQCGASPTYTIQNFNELPAILRRMPVGSET